MNRSRNQSSTPKAARAAALAVCFSVAAGACGGASDPIGSAEQQDTETDFAREAMLEVPPELSPSRSATEFDFCTDVPPGKMDLNQAAWLSFFAANEYAHYGYIGPLLKDYGFDDPDGATLDWRQCAIDRASVKDVQSEQEATFRAMIDQGILRDHLLTEYIETDEWGSCAQRWFDEYDGLTLPANAFKTWLVNNPKPYNYVEFVSGEQFTAHGQVYQAGSTQVVVARHPAKNIIIAAFRGTEFEWNDLAVDAGLIKVSLDTPDMAEAGWGPGWGKVHHGFFDAYRAVDLEAQQLGDALLEEGAQPEVYLTGHSLGAALATILASRILEKIERQVAAGETPFALRGVYTYGSPRVGNEQFVTRFNELAEKHGVTVARFRNGDDLVTNVPKFFYDHVGTMFHVVEDLPGTVEADSALWLYASYDDEPYWATKIGDHPSGGLHRSYSGTTGDPVWTPAKSGYYRRIDELYVRSRVEAEASIGSFYHCAD